jgi:hypothetical protein
VGAALPAIAHHIPTISGKLIVERVLANSNNASATTKRIEFGAKFPLHSLYPAAAPIDCRFNVARNFVRVNEVPGPNN